MAINITDSGASIKVELTADYTNAGTTYKAQTVFIPKEEVEIKSVGDNVLLAADRISFVFLYSDITIPAGGSASAIAALIEASLDITNPTPLGLLVFRSLTVDTDEEQVKASAGKLYGWNITNYGNALPLFVKFYNINGAVNPAADVPVFGPLMVPANGSIYQEPNCIQHEFAAAIAVRAVSGYADTDIVNPVSPVIVELKYY